MIDVAKYQQIVDASTPGKFEGEGPVTAYYYEAMLDGDGERVNDRFCSTVFEISDEERAAFGLTEPYFEIWVSDTGFVMAGEVTQAQYDAATN